MPLVWIVRIAINCLQVVISRSIPSHLAACFRSMQGQLQVAGVLAEFDKFRF